MGRKRTSSRPTYGDAARNHVISVILTATQFRILQPRVADYLKTGGVERTNFIMESFKLAWEGEDIMWDVKELWPSKEENPRWHREKKVCHTVVLYCQLQSCEPPYEKPPPAGQ